MAFTVCIGDTDEPMLQSTLSDRETTENPYQRKTEQTLIALPAIIARAIMQGSSTAFGDPRRLSEREPNERV